MPLRRTRNVAGRMARTAVVAGTATAVSHKVSASMQRSARNNAPAQPVQAAPVMSTPPSLRDEDIALLGKLMKLHNAGSLTDGEYELLKAKVLAS